MDELNPIVRLVRTLCVAVGLVVIGIVGGTSFGWMLAMLHALPAVSINGRIVCGLVSLAVTIVIYTQLAAPRLMFLLYVVIYGNKYHARSIRDLLNAFYSSEVRQFVYVERSVQAGVLVFWVLVYALLVWLGLRFGIIR